MTVAVTRLLPSLGVCARLWPLRLCQGRLRMATRLRLRRVDERVLFGEGREAEAA